MQFEKYIRNFANAWGALPTTEEVHAKIKLIPRRVVHLCALFYGGVLIVLHIKNRFSLTLAEHIKLQCFNQEHEYCANEDPL
jgi:hypothetical protein